MSDRVDVGILNTAQLQQGAGHLSASIIDGLVKCDRFRVTIFNQVPESPIYDGPDVRTVLLAGRDTATVRFVRTLAGACNLAFCGRTYDPIRRAGLDLLVATPTASLVGIYTGVPYVGSIADVMHHFYPGLPEFPRRVQWTRRYVYRKHARNALLTVVDSECGRDHVAQFLGISRERTHAAPFIPPPHVFVHAGMDGGWAEAQLAEFVLPQRFLFYPAQFWSHKNHVRLLQAVRRASELLCEPVQLVLTGSKRESYARTMQERARLGLESQVRVLGYVSDAQLVALYKRSVALVFPSLFGPTNIPLAEAVVLGVPLACSNLFAMPEQVGRAGLLFDPFSVEDMAGKLAVLWSNQEVRDDLRRQAAIRAPYFQPDRFVKDWLVAVGEGLRLAAAGV